MTGPEYGRTCFIADLVKCPHVGIHCRTESRDIEEQRVPSGCTMYAYTIIWRRSGWRWTRRKTFVS